MQEPFPFWVVRRAPETIVSVAVPGSEPIQNVGSGRRRAAICTQLPPGSSCRALSWRRQKTMPDTNARFTRRRNDVDGKATNTAYRAIAEEAYRLYVADGCDRSRQ